ncbi:hypothetical protein HK096_006215, partial [Nowakowskiella sp. JEL0078]
MRPYVDGAFLQITPMHSEHQENVDILKFSLRKCYHSIINEVLRDAVRGLLVQGNLACITFRFQDALDTSVFPLQFIHIPFMNWQNNHEIREPEEVCGFMVNLKVKNTNSI